MLALAGVQRGVVHVDQKGTDATLCCSPFQAPTLITHSLASEGLREKGEAEREKEGGAMCSEEQKTAGAEKKEKDREGEREWG